jgi:hypothetical protein
VLRATDAVEYLDKDFLASPMPLDKPESAAELRQRADHIRDVARNFSADETGQRLVEFAAEFEARALALEADKPR